MTDTETHAGTKATSSESQTSRALLGLRQLILGSELSPGDRISELWVVERLGVSRTPIRAALLRLQEEGLVEPIPSGGFAVRVFSEAEIRDSIELRGTLEGLAARLAAERGITQSTQKAMQDCVDKIDTLLDGDLSDASFAAYESANSMFHKLLAAASDSAVVQRQLEKVETLPFASANAFVMVRSEDPQARATFIVAQSQHRAVLDAIVRREGARAEAIMREHARIAHANLSQVLENQKVMNRLIGGNLIKRGL